MIFVNHSENNVRTSARTILLQIFTVYSVNEKLGPELTQIMLNLPYINFFGNLAIVLKQTWAKIDEKV